MAKRKHVMTPARKAALRKAQLSSAAKRRGKSSSRRRYTYDPIRRGVGTSGLQKNFTPYARVNKRSQTVGVNTGTIIPFTKKRIAFGGYVRVENTTRRGAIDRALAKAGHGVAPRGTKRGKVREYISQNVEVKNPAIRAAFPGGQIRLGTSRGAGPTVIVRRQRHPTPQKKSRSGVQRYDRRMKTIAGNRKRKARTQRRG